MFKSSSKRKAAIAAETSLETQRDLTCIVGKGTTIEGNFNSTDSVRVDGTVRGDITCEKRLLIGTSGWLEGTIMAQDVIVRGFVKGNLTVKGLLRLEPTAKIEGIITANAMEVESGAQYEGECKVGEQVAAKKEVKVALVA